MINMPQKNNAYPEPKPCKHITGNKRIRNLCPKCYQKWLRAVNKDHYLKSLKRSAKYYTEHKEHLLAINKVRRSQEPKWKRADIDLRWKYGISLKDYNEMYSKQGKKCAICLEKHDRKFKGKITRMHIDHDHLTGEVRALLCFHCNAGLGHFRDNIQRLNSAARYLELHKTDKRKLC